MLTAQNKTILFSLKLSLPNLDKSLIAEAITNIPIKTPSILAIPLKETIFFPSA